MKTTLIGIFLLILVISAIPGCAPSTEETEDIEDTGMDVEVPEAETEAPPPAGEEVTTEPEPEPEEQSPIDSLFPVDILPEDFEVPITALESEEPCLKLSIQEKIAFTTPEFSNSQSTTRYKEEGPHYKARYGNFMESENCDGTYQSVKFLSVTVDVILRKYFKEEDAGDRLLEMAESKNVKSPATFKGLPSLESSESTEIQERAKLLWREKNWIIYIDVSTYFVGLDSEAVTLFDPGSKVRLIRDKFGEEIYNSLHP